MRLEELGWKGDRPTDRDEDQLSLGRIAVEHKNRWIAYCEAGEITAEISGKLRRLAEEESSRTDDENPNWPVVGDWVKLDIVLNSDHGVIREILPRESAIRRKQAGRTSSGQVLVANVDWVFLLNGLDADFNPRRLERYLSMAYGSDVSPVVVLTKTDLSQNLDQARELMEAHAPGVPLHAISSWDGSGLYSLAPYFEGHRTVVLLGSSGVGKSTLINRLLGREVQRTQAISEIGKGRHTTTHRELLFRPQGGLVIDTPGLRELALYAEEGIDAAFSDLEVFAAQCHFRDCQHQDEPGCAVRDAIERGTLDSQRLSSYRKLAREAQRQEKNTDARARAEQNRRWKVIHKAQKALYKNRPKY